jgi:hypothetical protein
VRAVRSGGFCGGDGRAVAAGFAGQAYGREGGSGAEVFAAAGGRA